VPASAPPAAAVAARASALGDGGGPGDVLSNRQVMWRDTVAVGGPSLAFVGLRWPALAFVCWPWVRLGCVGRPQTRVSSKGGAS
jgi:hypothetical protein